MKITRNNILKLSDKLVISADYYRGVSLDEAIESCKLGHLVSYSREPMSIDWEVMKYGLGDAAREMSEEEINAWINYTIPWEPDERGIHKGVNLTSDESNAQGYAESLGGAILAIECVGNIAAFSDVHFLAEKPEDCIIKGVYYNGQWFPCNNFLNRKESSKISALLNSPYEAGFYAGMNTDLNEDVAWQVYIDNMIKLPTSKTEITEQDKIEFRKGITEGRRLKEYGNQIKVSGYDLIGGIMNKKVILKLTNALYKEIPSHKIKHKKAILKLAQDILEEKDGPSYNEMEGTLKYWTGALGGNLLPKLRQKESEAQSPTEQEIIGREISDIERMVKTMNEILITINEVMTYRSQYHNTLEQNEVTLPAGTTVEQPVPPTETAQPAQLTQPENTMPPTEPNPNYPIQY